MRFYREDYRALYAPGGPGPVWDRARQVGAQLATRYKHFERVYDVGTGTGGALHAFHEAGRTVSGVDLGEEYLAYGRKRLPRAELICGTEDDLPDGEADLVLALDTIEHRPDLLGALRAHRAKLAPGGVLVINVPALVSTVQTYHGLRQYVQIAHCWHFTITTLRAACAAAGLSCRGVEYGVVECHPIEPVPHVPDYSVAAHTVALLNQAAGLDREVPRMRAPYTAPTGD